MNKLLFLAAFLPMTVGAVEVSDTTFTVGGKSIVVDVKGEKTNVKVYGKTGGEETKVSEMNFVDGQEIETVYVGSPFIPTDRLQHTNFAPRFATAWIGMTNITGKVLGTHQIDHARFSKSFELGVTPYYMSVPFTKNNSFGMSVAAQIVWSHLCFQKDYAVNENGGKWGFEKLDKRAEGNNVNYLAARIPLMLSLQDNTDYYIGIGIAPELRTNAWYRLKGADGNTTDTYKLNRMSLNAMLSWGIGPIVFSGSFGVTPLFKTTDGKKVYQNSFSVGVDVLSLVKMINYCKDKKKQRK